MLEKIIAIMTVASIGLLAILLSATTPVTAGPFGILAIFIFSYIAALGITSYLLYVMSRLIVHLSSVFVGKRSPKGMAFKKAYYYSTVIAATPIMLIGLQSVGSIGIYEFALVLIFVIIGCVYITKRIS